MADAQEFKTASAANLAEFANHARFKVRERKSLN